MPISFFPIDLFGQSPRLYGLYTQLCLFFSLEGPDLRLQRDIEVRLRTGAERLVKQVPWLGGHVVQSGSGEYVIECSGNAPAILVRDQKSTLPDYQTIQQARFPFSMLDEKAIAPCRTLSGGDETAPPVVMMQANFVEGGLLLVVAAQHNCLDLRGETQYIELFAKACRNEFFTSEELEIANRTMTELGRTGHESLEVPATEPNHISTPPAPVHNDLVVSQDLARSRWVYFAFSKAALQRLKETAEQHQQVDFISTDDALSALVWQAVTRCRHARFGAGDITSRFQRQINARKHLGVPQSYLGNIVFTTQTVLPVTDVMSKPIGEIASQLRRSLEPEPSIEQQMRDTAAKLREELGATDSANATRRGHLPVTDIKLSSWAQEKCCELDFGGQLGVSAAIRRPSFEAWEGLAYFMPKARNGEIAVALCLRDDDVTKLRSDEDLCGFGEFVG